MKQDEQETDRKEMEKRTVTPTATKKAVQPSTTPAASNRVAKLGTPPTVGGREMKNKVVAPTSPNRSVEAITKPTASNKVARPDATSPLLEKPERIGAKVIVQRAGTAATVPQAVKSHAPSSAGKRLEKTAAETAMSFEVAKGDIDATSKPQGKKTHGRSIWPEKPAGKTDVDVKSKQDDQKPYVKLTSPRKIAANRRNGNKSKGPKTERGKSHSRRNSLKHGILSKALLITEGPGAEDSAAFYGWLKCLHLAWKPEGDREEKLVEEIAICDWREARALRTEAGLISRGAVIHRAEPPLEIAALRAVLGRDKPNKRDEELKGLTDYLSLPLGNPLDRVLRYETTIDRKRARAMTELDRLQLRRKGERVPAPVKVHLSTD